MATILFDIIESYYTTHSVYNSVIFCPTSISDRLLTFLKEYNYPVDTIDQIQKFHKGNIRMLLVCTDNTEHMNIFHETQDEIDQSISACFCDQDDLLLVQDEFPSYFDRVVTP